MLTFSRAPMARRLRHDTADSFASEGTMMIRWWMSVPGAPGMPQKLPSETPNAH
jgi:hypothetical protein